MTDLTPAKIGRYSAILAVIVALLAGPGAAIGYRYLSIFVAPIWLFGWLLVAALLAIHVYFSRSSALLPRLARSIGLFVASAVLSCGAFMVTAKGEQALEAERAELLLGVVLERSEALCSGDQVAAERIGRQDVLIDCSMPNRIAFPMPGGFADNWRAIVHDPTGGVLSIPEPNPTIQSTPHELRGLFGGDISSCTHIRETFYYCSFT